MTNSSNPRSGILSIPSKTTSYNFLFFNPLTVDTKVNSVRTTLIKNFMNTPSDTIAHGIDIVDVKRLESSIERFGQKFLDRVFTPFEQGYCQSKKKAGMLSYAGRFAVKEAVLKVLGTGWRDGISWTDVEVRNLPSGAPTVKLYNMCDDLAKELGIEKILISISHIDNTAMASAIGVGKARDNE